MIAGVYMLEIKKKNKTKKKNTPDGYSVTDHKCGIGVASIFDTVFRYIFANFSYGIAVS